MEGTQFLVQWDEHPTHLATRLGYLLEHQSLVDVTLMCSTHTLKVHRAVLAACSPYFERQLGNHPLIVLKNMKFSVLKSLVEFMYCGEASVSEDNLTPLLEAAKFFEVKGLAAMTKESVCHSNTSALKLNGTTPLMATSHSSTVMMGNNSVGRGGGGSSGRGRGRGRGRPPLTNKVSSPTESAQILLSLSGGNQPTAHPTNQLFTTSKNVKIDPSVLTTTSTSAVDPGGGVRQQTIVSSGLNTPRRRGRRRSSFNYAIRERFLHRDSDSTSPLLSSLLTKQEDTKNVKDLQDLGLPANVGQFGFHYDIGQGKLGKLTEDVLKNVISSDGTSQFHVTDNAMSDDITAASTSSSSSPTLYNKKNSNTMCEMVFDKENKHFVVKEMQTFPVKQEMDSKGQLRESPSTFLHSDGDNKIKDTDLESLKSGVATEAESDPDAVVVIEVTDDKKVQKCVLSAKDIDNLKELNEKLSKQKKQLADMTRDASLIDAAGNAQVAELKLEIGKTKSVLAKIIEKVEGFKNIKDFSTKMLTSEDSNEESKKRPQSQVVQLEFIDGNGEKIEGYQVEGTLVDKRLRECGIKKEGSECKETDLRGLLDMVWEGSEPSLIAEAKKNKLVIADDDPTDLMGGADHKDINYHLVMNNQLGDQTISYENLDDMISESHNIVIENKGQDLKYLIDNDGNIINQEDFVVYHSVKEEMPSNEYVIYDGTESVLPDITHHGSENFDVCEEESQVIQNEDCTEFIVYGDNKSDLREDMKHVSDPSGSGQFIVYSDENMHSVRDSFHSTEEQKSESFVMFPPDKVGDDDANSVDGLIDRKSPSKCVPSSVSLLTAPLDKFDSDSFCEEDHRKHLSDCSTYPSCSDNSRDKRRCSINSDSSLESRIECKKQKLALDEESQSS